MEPHTGLPSRSTGRLVVAGLAVTAAAVWAGAGLSHTVDAGPLLSLLVVALVVLAVCVLAGAGLAVVDSSRSRAAHTTGAVSQREAGSRSAD